MTKPIFFLKSQKQNKKNTECDINIELEEKQQIEKEEDEEENIEQQEIEATKKCSCEKKDKKE